MKSLFFIIDAVLTGGAVHVGIFVLCFCKTYHVNMLAFTLKHTKHHDSVVAGTSSYLEGFRSAF